MTPAAAAERYIAFCEGMTPVDLDRLADFCAPEVHFRDPFNEVSGLAAYRRVLEKMFRDIGQPAFQVTGHALAGEVCYLRWRFAFRRAKGETMRILGMSEVHFDAEGRVTAQIDYWDAGQVYETVPLLRGLARLVKRRLSVG
ncbi:nuclear transport factor 2 family protein [Pelagibius marinus]|uniref:nuclear transport factor 2 family protein n=1 Tax=Pelagibius marinus TaxID=2762760 RepID=UPI001D03CE5C|nr:nuclear transport factor 2 family protein [Pelagibius marinus]